MWLCRLSHERFANTIIFGYFAKDGHAFAKVFAVFDGAVDIFCQPNQKQSAPFDDIYNLTDDNTAERMSLNIQVNRHLLRDDFYVEFGVGVIAFFPNSLADMHYLNLPECSCLEDDMGVNSAASGKVECPGNLFTMKVGNHESYTVVFYGFYLGIVGKVLTSYDESVG